MPVPRIYHKHAWLISFSFEGKTTYHSVEDEAHYRGSVKSQRWCISTPTYISVNLLFFLWKTKPSGLVLVLVLVLDAMVGKSRVTLVCHILRMILLRVLTNKLPAEEYKEERNSLTVTVIRIRLKSTRRSKPKCSLHEFRHLELSYRPPRNIRTRLWTGVRAQWWPSDRRTATSTTTQVKSIPRDKKKLGRDIVLAAPPRP
jgi:hypothetical protein